MRMNNFHRFKSLIIGVCRIPILHPDGCTTFVVEVDQKIVAPSLGDNAAAFQCVDMIPAVHGLSRAEAVGGVDVGLSLGAPRRRSGGARDQPNTQPLSILNW